MSMNLGQVLCAVFVVWCVAVVIKAVTALRRGEPYVFSMWDGGAIRVGKKLGRTGTQVKIAVGILMGACLAALATRSVVPYGIAFPSLVVVVAVGILCDFLLAEDD